MHCSRCESGSFCKAGFKDKKQRYLCRDCGCHFTQSHSRRYSEQVKAQAIAMYLEGLGFRAIGRLLGVSNVAVLKWVRQAADVLPAPSCVKVVDVLELDELWHFVKKRLSHSGCGLRLTVNETPLLTSKQVVVVAEP